MQPEPTLGIVADDLTGANDTLVQFAEAGFLARLSLAGPDTLADPDTGHSTAAPAALALVTDARPLDADHARSRTSEAVHQLSRTGINRLYVKIDSTMRGSVAGQIAGALQAWGETHPDPFAVVCPAYPAMGRVVDGGQLLVHGERVELSPAGSDPVTPVLTSGMRDLLPDAVLAPNLSTVPAEQRANVLLSAAQESSVVVVDATTQSDLGVIAAALLELGSRAVPVGSAGLAAALAAEWTSPVERDATILQSVSGRTLVVVSSLHDVSREQTRVLTESCPDSELVALYPTMDNLRTAAAAEAWLEEKVPPHDLPSTVVMVSPSRTGSREEGQPDGANTGARVADGLATLATALMERHRFSNLVLMGGDGARAVLRACGAESVTVRGAVQEGVPLGVINGGRAHGVRTVTKAGGFGSPETLVHILETLTKHIPLSTEAS